MRYTFNINYSKLNKTDSITEYSGTTDDYSFKLIYDTWIIEKLKTTANTLVDLNAKAPLITKIWHGEPAIASYTVHPNWEMDSRDSSSDLMFDNDMDTFWLAEGYFSGPKRVEIEFNV